MTETDTLAAFLLARIAEDDEAATYATNRDGVGRGAGGWGGWWLGHYQHYSRWDPARVLAECAAKRRVVGRYEGSLANRHAHPNDLASAGSVLALLGAVKLLALPYANHPDYRPEWWP